jgi:GT2 family glycosyltransferase
MVAVKTGIAKLVGGFRKEFDGSQDYDFVLRCIENSENVYHIPKILYHWRFHENSTAENPENKLYCFEAGRKAIQEYLNRNAVDAHVKQCKKLGYYRLHYNLESIKTLPSVEVIVYGNNRKHTSQQVLSVIQKSLYVSKVTDIYTQDCKEINTCVSQSAADYILFLNRDVCALSGDSIEELLGYCTRKDVAAAGSYVIGKRHRIYHTGIVVGMYGMYGYLHRGISKNYEGYYGRITMPQDMSAVDFSCTMISVESWKEEGGLDEKMPFDMACVDFCLRAGGDRLIVYNPWSKVKICRSASVREEKKKIQNMPDNAERLFKERWAAFFEGGDPHYNVNLSLKNNAYKIKA